ncbi:hypothetical protein HG530_010359 [Fusarium avenaceum]|nr:hypothetical protein HG530_010359 [Fusarium avenaceum]
MSDQYNYPPPPSEGRPIPQPDDVVPSIEVASLTSSGPQAPSHQYQSQPDTQAQHPQAQHPQAQHPQAQHPQAQHPQAQQPQAQQPQAPANGTAKAKGPAKPRAPRAKPLSKKQQGKLPEETAQKTPKKTPKPRKTQPKTSRKRSLDEAEVASPSGSAEKKVARENNHPSHPSNTRKVATQQPTPRQTASFDRSSAHVNSIRGGGPSTYDDYLDDVIVYLRSSSSRRSSGQKAATPSEEQDQDPIDLTRDDSMAEPIDPQLQEQPPAPVSAPVSAVHPDSNTRMIGSISLTRANLGLNTNLTPSEIIRRFFTIDQELEEQLSRVPTLPPSTLAQQPPKEFVGAYYKTIPEAQDPRLDAFVEDLNRPLLEKSKTIDLERNNIAAKGTRNRRDEALKMYRRLANDQQVELNWWRLKACSLGADPYDWDAVPQDAKQAMTDDMDNRVLKEEEKIAFNEKKQRSQVHAVRNTENAQRMREDSQVKEKIVQQYWAALQQGDADHVDFLEQQYLQEKAAASSAGNSNNNGASASATVGNAPVTAGENAMDAEGENESFDAAGAGENNSFNNVGANNATTDGNAFNADFSTAFGNTSAFNNITDYTNSNGTGIGFGNGYQGLSTMADQNATGGFGLSPSNQLMLNQPQANSAFQANQLPDYGFQSNIFVNSQVQSNQSDNAASISEQVQDSNSQVNSYEDNPFMNNNFVTNNFPTSRFANNNFTNKLKNNNFANTTINNDLANTTSQPEQGQIGGLMDNNSGLQQPQEAQQPVHESPTTDALVHNTQASQVFSPSAAASGSSNNYQNMSFTGLNAVPDNIFSNPPNMGAAQSNNLDFDQATEFPERDLFSFAEGF